MSVPASSPTSHLPTGSSDALSATIQTKATASVTATGTTGEEIEEFDSQLETMMAAMAAVTHVPAAMNTNLETTEEAVATGTNESSESAESEGNASAQHQANVEVSAVAQSLLKESSSTQSPSVDSANQLADGETPAAKLYEPTLAETPVETPNEQAVASSTGIDRNVGEDTVQLSTVLNQQDSDEFDALDPADTEGESSTSKQQTSTSSLTNESQFDQQGTSNSNNADVPVARVASSPLELSQDNTFVVEPGSDIGSSQSAMENAVTNVTATSQRASRLATEPIPVIDQVVEHVLSTQNVESDGEKHLEITLDPPELGKIRIRLRDGADGLEAKLLVTESATAQLIRDSLPQLTETLSDSGILLNDFGQEDSTQEQHEASEDERSFGIDSPQTSGEEDVPVRRTSSSNSIDVLVN